MMALLSLLQVLLKFIPAFLALIKGGKLVVEEIGPVLKWFVKHKAAGAKTVYAVPEEAVNKEVLDAAKPADTCPVIQSPYSTPDEFKTDLGKLHEIAIDGDSDHGQ